MMTDLMVAELVKEDEVLDDVNDPYFGDNGDEPDHSEDPFWDGKSHLPSGQEFTPNPKKITGTRRSKRLSSASTFNGKTRKHWESQGYIVEKVETMGMVNRAVVKQDFCGCFDFIAISLGRVVLIQVSSKDKVRDHLRKMLGDKEYRPGRTRRDACDFFAKVGWKMVIHWFDQPGGDGTKWVEGIEEITPQLIYDIDAGRRTRRVK
jgi:hypothetical protein